MGHDHHHHDHPHPHGPLESIEHVHGGAPMLDIGGDIGALVVLMDDDSAGTELHLRAEHGPAVHTGVWTRHQGNGHVTAALFCELAAGTYWVLDADGDDVSPVAITGGALTSADLRTARAGVTAES